MNESDTQLSNKSNKQKFILHNNEKNNINNKHINNYSHKIRLNEFNNIQNGNKINDNNVKENSISEKINTPFDENDFSCSFIYDKIININYSTIKNSGKIKFNMKVKNNGANIIPKKTEIISLENDDESQFYITDTMINNGNSIKTGEIIELTIFLFPKDNIVIGNNNLTFKLKNQYFGIIGKENNITINIIDDRVK
jgi:hypothetical protein